MIDKTLLNINRIERPSGTNASGNKKVSSSETSASSSTNTSAAESDINISDFVQAKVQSLLSEPAPDNAARITQLQSQISNNGYSFDANSLANNLMDEYFNNG